MRRPWLVARLVARLVACAGALAAAQPATTATPRPGVPVANGAALGVVPAPAAAPAPITSARSLYVLHCAGCHGFDAAGVPSQGVPSMRGALGPYLRLPEGRAYLVQVPGVNSVGLSDAQIALVTNWMVQQFSAETAPEGWTPFTTDEVAAARATRPADVAQARARLLARLAQAGATR